MVVLQQLAGTVLAVVQWVSRPAQFAELDLQLALTPRLQPAAAAATAAAATAALHGVGQLLGPPADHHRVDVPELEAARTAVQKRLSRPAGLRRRLLLLLHGRGRSVRRGSDGFWTHDTPSATLPISLLIALATAPGLLAAAATSAGGSASPPLASASGSGEAAGAAAAAAAAGFCRAAYAACTRASLAAVACAHTVASRCCSSAEETKS